MQLEALYYDEAGVRHCTPATGIVTVALFDPPCQKVRRHWSTHRVLTFGVCGPDLH